MKHVGMPPGIKNDTGEISDITKEFINKTLDDYIGTGTLCENYSSTSSFEDYTDFDNSSSLPRDMTFGAENVISVAAYSCFFVIAACGNLTVFITLFRNRNIKSRVNLFIMHLSMADLFVTFVMMPMEIGWHITVEWKAGDAGCRILMFFRTFGLYLSSFVLVTISLDRYFAILHPLSLNDADKRGKIMLTFAWIFSTIASIPQSVIFHVEEHPDHPWFKQCVTFNFFPTPMHELIYNLFHMIAMYGLPLVIITLSYTIILCEISKKTKQSKEEMQELNGAQTRNRLRRSAVGNIEKARTRTLKMTVVIVGVFVLCWTPYFVLAAWWWFDRESAAKLDSRIQKGLFMFAVSNSCMNPIVYGLFTINFKREFARCCCCFKSEWGQRILMPLTGNYLTSRANKNQTGYTRASYTLVRSSGVVNGNVKETSVDGHRKGSSVRYSLYNESSGSHGSSNDSPAGNGTMTEKNRASESRKNLNNFISVQMPAKEDPDRTDV